MPTVNRPRWPSAARCVFLAVLVLSSCCFTPTWGQSGPTWESIQLPLWHLRIDPELPCRWPGCQPAVCRCRPKIAMWMWNATFGCDLAPYPDWMFMSSNYICDYKPDMHDPQYDIECAYKPPERPSGISWVPSAPKVSAGWCSSAKSMYSQGMFTLRYVHSGCCWHYHVHPGSPWCVSGHSHASLACVMSIYALFGAKI